MALWKWRKREFLLFYLKEIMMRLFIFLSILLFISVNAFGQALNEKGVFFVKGQLGKLDTGFVYIYKDDNINKPWKQIRIEESQFSFTDSSSGVDFLMISVNDEPYVNSFFIQAGLQTNIFYDTESKYFIAEGTFDNEIYFEFKRKIKPFQIIERSIQNALNTVLQPEEKATLLNKLQNNSRYIFSIGKEIVENNSKELSGVQIMFEISPYDSDNQIKHLLNNISTEYLHDHWLVKTVKRFLLPDTLSSEQLNKINFYDYTRIDLVSSFKGKLLLVDFWATWCIPCVKEMPRLKEISTKFDSSKVLMIAISLDKDTLQWISMYKKFNLTRHNYLLTDFGSLQSDLKFQAIPYRIIVLPDGKIGKANVTIDEIESVLSELNFFKK